MVYLSKILLTIYLLERRKKCQKTSKKVLTLARTLLSKICAKLIDFLKEIILSNGLRLMEYVRLRVRELDFERRLIYIRAAKGGEDRSTLFPESIHPLMKSQVEAVEKLHKKDLADGYGEVYLPGALARQYPNAAKSFGW